MRVVYRITNIYPIFLGLALACFTSSRVGVAAEGDDTSLNKTQKSIYETLAVSEKIKESAEFKGEADVSLPSFESIEAKAVNYKLSDSLWKLSEDYSVKQTERFIAETSGSFDKNETSREFKDSFREYLKNNDLVKRDSTDGFDKAKTDFVREDEMADFKVHMKDMDDSKLFKESQKEYKEFLVGEAKLEKTERKLERQGNVDRKIAKKDEAKKEEKIEKEDKKDDKKDDNVAKEEDKKEDSGGSKDKKK